jgi:hypothetical protein
VVDIFDEVSDDLRAERATRLLRRYGSLLIIAAIAVLIGVGGQQAWQYEQQKRANAAATAYLAITGQIDTQGAGMTDDQRVADAKALLNFAAGAPEGYRAIATLRAAGLYEDAGQSGPADAAWNRLGQDADADPLLRDLANLLWAQHELGQVPDGAVAERLLPLTAADNPYHALARETQALMFLNEGNIAQAKTLFTQIAADPTAPDGVRTRADGLLVKLQG